MLAIPDSEGIINNLSEDPSGNIWLEVVEQVVQDQPVSIA